MKLDSENPIVNKHTDIEITHDTVLMLSWRPSDIHSGMPFWHQIVAGVHLHKTNMPCTVVS